MSLALLADGLQTHECGECGIRFAAPSVFWAERHRDHSVGWYCPNGHRRFFIGETDAAKFERLYKQEQEEAQRQRERAERIDRQLSASRGQVTKIKKRVGNGVCPCCNRTFANLGRHMGSKHPNYSTQELP